MLLHGQSVVFATPWTVARQAPLSMGFPRQEYWSGLPLPPPGDLPNPGIEPTSSVSLALAGGFFTTAPSVLCHSSQENRIPDTHPVAVLNSPADVCSQHLT